MDYNEIIDQQIDLLAGLNRQLAGQVNPEAIREIRKNIMLIIKLAELEDVQCLEVRVKRLEDFIIGNSENQGLAKYIDNTNITMDDHEERLNSIEVQIESETEEEEE